MPSIRLNALTTSTIQNAVTRLAKLPNSIVTPNPTKLSMRTPEATSTAATRIWPPSLWQPLMP